MKFAKLFEVKESQVIIQKKYDQEEKECPFGIEQVTIFNNIKGTVLLSFKSEKKRDKEFEKYNQESADGFYKGVADFWS